MADQNDKGEVVMEKESKESSFSGCLSYSKALAQTPKRLKERVGATWTVVEEMTQIRERSGANMQRKLEWYDLVSMGVGGMLGAGVFVTTGTAVKSSGPAVVLSYVVAGVSALLSAFCYTEFAVEMPVAGGAFSYLRITFGEFTGYFAGANLLMEYVLSNAGVARTFTSYLSSVFGIIDNPNAWRVKASGLPEGYNMLDFTAVALVILLTICLCHSTKESSILNIAVTFFHLLFFTFIIVAGFANGDVQNLTKPANPSHRSGFAPYGIRGVFSGAAIVYFSYIGYDSVSTLAEEIKNPSKSLPLGISGSVLIVSLLYCLMSVALCVLRPYDQISSSATFAEAFEKLAGWSWASNVVGLGATLGIVTSLLVAMLGQARYLCVIGRARLIPYWFARVHPSTGTPVNATFFLGICTAVIALFTDLDIVVHMVSIGTLVVFYIVANALIYRRYVKIGVTNPLPTVTFLLLFSASAAGFALFWQLQVSKWWGLVMFGVISIGLTAGFQFYVPTAHHPKEWGVPFMPWFPATSIFLNVFLLSTLDRKSYERFGIWSAVVIVFYVFYSVHSSHDAEARLQDINITQSAKDIEIMPQLESSSAGQLKLEIRPQ